MKKKTFTTFSGACVLAAAGLSACASQQATPQNRPEVPVASETPLDSASPSYSPSETPFATLSPTPDSVIDPPISRTSASLTSSPARTLAPSSKPSSTPVATAPASAFKDGTYDASGSYFSPAGSDQIAVELSIKNDVVTAVTVTPQAQNGTSARFQQKLADGIGTLVVGKALKSISTFSSVNGSSLSPQGFQQAVEKIKQQASQNA